MSIIKTYIVPSDRILHRTKVDFSYRVVTETIHVVQYDKQLPIVKVELFVSKEPYTIPDQMDVRVRVGKRDKTFIYKSVLGCNEERNTVYFEIDDQMSYIHGKIEPIIELALTYESTVLKAGSSPIYINIDRNPIQDYYLESDSQYILLEEAIMAAKKALDDAETAVAIVSNIIDESRENLNNTINAKNEAILAKNEAINAVESIGNSVDIATDAKDQAIDAKIAAELARDEVLENIPNIPEWALEPNPPTYNAEDVGARSDIWLPKYDEILGDKPPVDADKTPPLKTINNISIIGDGNIDISGSDGADYSHVGSEEPIDENKNIWIKVIDGNQQTFYERNVFSHESDTIDEKITYDNTKQLEISEEYDINNVKMDYTEQVEVENEFGADGINQDTTPQLPKEEEDR